MRQNRMHEYWWKPGGKTPTLHADPIRLLAYALRKTAQAGASTSSATDQEAEVERRYSLSEWDVWFADTDSSESETMVSW